MGEKEKNFNICNKLQEKFDLCNRYFAVSRLQVIFYKKDIFRAFDISIVHVSNLTSRNKLHVGI